MTAAVLLLLGAWTEAEREAQVEALRARPVEERIVSLSEGFLGTPYAFSPLGEGSGHDVDPRIRYDAVDCLTLVEEVMAMALAPDAASRLPVLDAIRYSGAPAWETRNHLMEAQWLPHLQARGVLRDITREVAGPLAERTSKQLTRRTWKAKEGASLALPATSQPLGTFALDVVPVKRAVEVLKRAPSGTVVVVVRADRPTRITRVSHVGFLIQTPKGPVLRHASRSFKRVTDEPLAHYLSRNLDFASWTIESLALFAVTAPSEGKLP
ncbi:MAG: DUF1460 domain-containing protein [Archangium sp.]|nr:DUF1460 domain-containing protein [Archangium sp.]